MLLAIVFSVSFAVLAFEVLLTRIFSIAQWYHLTFMVISIALFGFAAAGTCLGILEVRGKGLIVKYATPVTYQILAIAYTFSTIIVFVILAHLPLNYFRLPVDPRQILFLTASYFLPAIPFFIAGLTVALAYIHHPELSGRIYFANMTGSALGATTPLFFLPILSEEQLSIILSLVPLLILVIRKSQPGDKNALKQGAKNQILAKRLYQQRLLSPAKRWAALGVGVILAVVLLLPQAGKILKIRPTTYKDLSQIRQFPDTQVVDTVNSIRGRIDTVKSPYIRYAPGLSLKWTQPITAQLALFKDGDGRMVFYEPTLEEARQWAPYTLAWAGYLLPDRPAERMLLFIRDGGTAMACAAAAKPAELTVVSDHPALAERMAAHYQLPVVVGSPALFMAQSSQKYDLIHVENWGSSMSGTTALVQNHAFTIEQLQRYLKNLTSDGVLIFSRRLKLPPADMGRLWATAFLALKRQKRMTPSHHLVILRNWDTFTLIVSARPLKSLDKLINFARDRNFDFVFRPQIVKDEVNRYNRFNNAYYYLEIKRLAGAYREMDPDAYFDSYLLDARPQNDQRPFPNHFLKWRRIDEIYKTSGSRFYSLFLSGEIIVIAVFIEAILLSLILLILPFLFGKEIGRLSIYQNGFFLAVGTGFILAEIYLIKTFTHVFGNPIISFSFVLTGVLLFSGVGGFFSHYLSHKHLYGYLAVLITLFISLFFLHEPLVQMMLPLNRVPRYALAGLILLPIGLLLGLAFPMGMQNLLHNSSQRARAWAINGCASVVSAVAAIQIVIIAGFAALILIAAGIYLVALICFVRST